GVAHLPHEKFQRFQCFEWPRIAPPRSRRRRIVARCGRRWFRDRHSHNWALTLDRLLLRPGIDAPGRPKHPGRKMVTRFNAVDRRGADTIAILRYRAIPPLLSHYLAQPVLEGGPFRTLCRISAPHRRSYH